MNLNLLIIQNDNKERDYSRFREYLEEKTPYEVTISVKNIIFPLKAKDFNITGKIGGRDFNLYGLDGIKDKLREFVPIFTYDIVFFVYCANQVSTVIPQNSSLANYTYFNPLYPGTEFSEILDSGDLLRVMTHEVIHAFHYMAKRINIPTNDTMDIYDDEFDIFSPTGNRERNLKEFKPYWNSILNRGWVIDLIKNLLNRLIAILKKNMNIDNWAEAIKQFEGWYVGSRSYRNNNPGNLRYSKYMIGTDNGGYAIFKDYDTGLKALKYQLEIAINGKSRVYNPDMTIEQFFEVYAPSSDNNHPKKYAKFVADKLGVPVTLKINAFK